MYRKTFACLVLIICASCCILSAEEFLRSVTLGTGPESDFAGNPATNCDQQQPGPAYSLDTTDAVGSFVGQEYSSDKLSDRDQLVYKSREPAYWRAPDQESLKQVLIIHRHGDRTPIEFPPRDPLASEAFWSFHGLGQLTNRGKARLHVLGQLIRHRYDSFLNGSVNKNMRKSRASGALRCIESSQVFLSSFLGLDQRMSPDAKSLVWGQKGSRLGQLWQPASINTLAAKYDGMLNEGAECPVSDVELDGIEKSEDSRKLYEEFKHEREVLESEIGFVVDHFYKWSWASSLLEIERSYFAHKFRPALRDIYDRLDQASDLSLVLTQRSLKLRRIRVGLLLNDMINNMAEMSAGSKSMYHKKFVHYSSHDINLIFLLGVFENIENFPHRPDYASNVILELHQDPDLKEWYVRLFYAARTPSKPVELHIGSCEKGNARQRCTLEAFAGVMSEYRVSSWAAWMRECGNSMEGVNPYEQNS